MLIFGPISSLFDYLTFGALLLALGVNEHVFQTGWFVESPSPRSSSSSWS